MSIVSSVSDSFDTAKMHISVDAPIEITLKQKVRAWMSETGNQIPISVIIAIGLGVVINNTVEHVSPDVIKVVELPGLMWIRALKSIVIALIFTSMILSMQSLKRIPGGGSKIAKGAFGFYLGSTVFALIESIAFILMIMVPNLPLPAEAAETTATGATVIVDKAKDLILGLIPQNLVESMAMNDLIAIITAGVVVGCLIRDEDPERPSIFMKYGSSLYTNDRFVVEIERVVSVIVHFLIQVSPIGIFFLILPSLMETSFSELFGAIKWYLITLFAALSFHLLVFYPIIFFALVRENPFPFFKQFMPVATTAFGTASSLATIPFAVECSHKVGIRPSIYKFLIPLGTALNMNGTAIHFPIQIAFMAISVGRVFTTIDYFLLGFVAFLATVGASPIPGVCLRYSDLFKAGIAFMLMMMDSMSVPNDNPMFKLIIAMEWLTERPEAVVNCMGDPIASAYCQKTLMKIPLDPSLNGEYNIEAQETK